MVAFGTSLSVASLSVIDALYQVSVRQATISLSLLLAHTSRCKPWESLWGSSTTTPLVDFHHRLTACPSYYQKARPHQPCLSHTNHSAHTTLVAPLISTPHPQPPNSTWLCLRLILLITPMYSIMDFKVLSQFHQTLHNLELQLLILNYLYIDNLCRIYIY